MNLKSDKVLLEALFENEYGCLPSTFEPLAAAGSNRRYYLLSCSEREIEVVGTCGDDIDENKAFIYLSRHFADRGLNVPRILAVSSDETGYLQTYIPGKSLFDLLKTDGASTKEYIAKAMELLANFHFIGSEELDFSRCYPEEAMNQNMVNWDLNYFKYLFLKPSGVEFNERELQADFDRLAEKLLAGQNEWTSFMYRDFQSRNIIVSSDSGHLYGIDFQGGRRGPGAYDVASFLWQAKACFSPETRQAGVRTYCECAAQVSPQFNIDRFNTTLPYFVLFRLLQTLGAYGFRGVVERKPHFLESLPLGVRNLQRLFAEEFPQLAEEFPYLSKISTLLKIEERPADNGDGHLTVTVQSFSYRKGYPADASGNGGGFVFDCRGVHNPGRYEQYKPLTGMDEPVRRFLEDDGEIFPFLDNAYALVDAAVRKYLKRGFTSLCVGFGCTGGRHRSVYSAHAMAEHIRNSFPEVRVVEIHREQPQLLSSNKN